jgi:hypothetical protein
MMSTKQMVIVGVLVLIAGMLMLDKLGKLEKYCPTCHRVISRGESMLSPSQATMTQTVYDDTTINTGDDTFDQGANWATGHTGVGIAGGLNHDDNFSSNTMRQGQQLISDMGGTGGAAIGAINHTVGVVDGVEGIIHGDNVIDTVWKNSPQKAVYDAGNSIGHAISSWF